MDVGSTDSQGGGRAGRMRAFRLLGDPAEVHAHPAFPAPIL